MTVIKIKQQSGVVLMITLLLLILVTIIVITSLQVTGLQEKMVTNFNNKNLAYQASEIALRDAEEWLLAQIPAPTIAHARIWALETINPTATIAGLEWWQASWPTANDFEYGDAIPGITSKPNTVIEYRGFVSDSLDFGATSGRYFYTITSRGTGGNDQSVVILQSTLARR